MSMSMNDDLELLIAVNSVVNNYGMPMQTVEVVDIGTLNRASIANFIRHTLLDMYYLAYVCYGKNTIVILVYPPLV